MEYTIRDLIDNSYFLPRICYISTLMGDSRVIVTHTKHILADIEVILEDHVHANNQRSLASHFHIRYLHSLLLNSN